MAPPLDLLAVGPTPAPASARLAVAATLEEAKDTLRYRRFDLILTRNVSALVDRELASAAPVVVPEALTDAQLDAIVAAWTGPTDPHLGELAVGYAERLATRIQTIEEACSAGDLSILARLGHQIAGTAALYGLPGVGRECDMLCTAARAGQPDACAWQVDRVVRIWRVSLEQRASMG